MKDSIKSRLDRLADVVKGGTSTCLVAIKGRDGIEWNGVIYPDEEALDHAFKLLCGEYPERPLVIITIG